MAATEPSKIPLVMGDDPEPNYNWFGDFDYAWFQNSGTFSSVPYFESVPDQLDELVETSAARRPLRLGFGPNECTTVSGSRNCTEACSDPSFLFTPANLGACTTLASAALLVQNGTYAVNQSDAETIATTDSWHIPDLSTFNATGVLESLVACIPESCTVSKLGECTDDVENISGVEIRPENLALISSKLGHYCDNTNLETNPDIAGPGVVLSYFVQTGLAVILYLLLKISTTWARRLDIFLERFCENGAGRFRKRLGSFRSKLADSRVGSAVVSSLVEFQEVQTYFILSVQIATLVSYNPQTTETTGVNNSSYAAVLLNSGLAALLNTNSFTCIMLAQCGLRRARMHWWYIFGLMTFSFGLAITIFARRNSLMPPAEGLWDKFKGDSLLPLCGDNPSPMTYCKPPRGTRFLDSDFLGFALCGVGALAWVGLFIDQLACAIPKRFPALALRFRDPDREHMFIWGGKPWRYAFAIYWFVVEFLLLVMAIYNARVLSLVAGDVNIGSTAGWSFGQYIAVTVWFPTIAKFVYFNIFGVKEGFEERIPRSFTITKDEDGDGVREGLLASGRKLSHSATYPN